MANEPVVKKEETSPTPQSMPPQPDAGFFRRYRLYIALFILLIVVASGAGYYIFVHPKHQAAAVVAPKPHIPDATWLTTPEKIADPGVFANLKKYYDVADGGQLEAITYEKVGSFYGKDIIMADIPSAGPSPTALALILKNGPKSYALLKKHTAWLYDADSGKYVGPDLTALMSVDPNTDFPSITYQKELSVTGVTLTNTTKQYQLYADWIADNNSSQLPQPTKYADTKYGPLFQFEMGSGDGFTIKDFVLKMPDGESLDYQLLPPFIKDNADVPQVTWNGGSASNDPYRYDGTGSCGSDESIAALNDSSGAGLTPAGKTAQGAPVYQFASAGNATLKYFYTIYQQNTAGTTDAEGKPIPVLTISQFAADHGVFVFKDALGRYVVFANSDETSIGGCGKPVIYLYPTKPTHVSVKVGATITKSDPLYNSGWNVLAQPSGDLTWNGQHFDSLFWEGYSQNPYPLATSGFVVKQADLKTTISSQLHQLGLNDKETSDFEAFWLPRLPKTPYVRLTWFGTAQMNALAPLHITPAPETLIRVFLDYQGLQQPVSVPAERLSAIPRRGFTVVEWGGELGEK